METFFIQRLGILIIALVSANHLPAGGVSAYGETPRHILILHGANTLLPANVIVERLIRGTVAAVAHEPVDFDSETFDAPSVGNAAYESAFVNVLRQKYRDRKFDIVVTVQTPALDFVLKHQRQLWAEAAVVFLGVSEDALRRRSLNQRITGVVGRIDFPGTVDLALRLQPNTKRVLVVSGVTETDQAWIPLVRSALRPFEDRLDVNYLTNHSLAEILNRVSALPKDAIVLYTSMFQDGAGQTTIPGDVMAQLATVSAAPVYGFYGNFMGLGMLGGAITDFDGDARQVGKLVSRILAGENPAELAVQPPMPSKATVDWRQLKRWGLSERALPPDVVVLFRQAPLWREYRWLILGVAAVLGIETLLIFALVLQRRRRKRAETGAEMQCLELAHANVSLTLSEAKNRAILNALPDVMFIQTMEGVYVDWYCKGPGELLVPAANFLGKNMTAVLPAPLAQEFAQCFKRAAESGEPVIHAFNLTINEQRRCFEARMVPYDEQILTLVRDITDRVAVEEALRQSEARLKLAMDAAGVGFWEIDVGTGRVARSESLERMLGASPGSLAPNHSSFLALVHPEDRERIRLRIEEGFVDTEIVETEYRVVRPDGAIRWIGARSRLIGGVDGRAPRVLGFAADITDRKRVEDDLKKALAEVQRFKDRLEAENLYLRSEVMGTHRHGAIIGESDAIKKVLEQVERVAATDMTVLVLGETGTGKELVARLVHEQSVRRERPLVKVNCSALPAELIESELFGHEKGAFTGATARQVGRFELADRGTIFLDEIGELPLRLQPKLLRVLQEGEFERVGSGKTIKVDVRVIAATNRNLSEAVQHGRFRADLYFRLNVYPIEIPPLRERGEDIGPLAELFLREAGRRLGKTFEETPVAMIEALQGYGWPGNVRELENVISRAAVTSVGGRPQLPNEWNPGVNQTERIGALKAKAPAHLNSPAVSAEPAATLGELAKTHILEVLQQTNWRIEGPKGAARILGLHPNTLRSRMRKLGIQRSARGRNNEPRQGPTSTIHALRTTRAENHSDE
jgi:PAS domain S-box-containing protein